MGPNNSHFFMFTLLLVAIFLHYNGALAVTVNNPSVIISGTDGDRDALLSLMATFNNSLLNDSWKGLTVCFLNSTSPWYGVTCLNDRVVGLSLDNLGLTGEIQANALANLNELLTLSFNKNSISGYLMDFSYNQKLTKVDMSSNNFDGPIPPSLVTLNSLESLLLQENRLTGSILEFNQSTLKEFNVSDNSLSGTIPNTPVLQSFGPSSYANNIDVCGKPSPTACNNNIRRPVIKSATSNSSDIVKSGSSNHNRFGIMLVVLNVIGLIILLALLTVYYKKLKLLRSGVTGREINNVQDYGQDEEEKGKGVVEGDDQDKGKLAFMEGVVGFELSDLFKASAESLGKGSFGNTYKAILDDGRSVVVKRMRDLKPLSGNEFVKQLAAMADLRHPNLLPLLAFYYSKDEKLLVHKFMPHGNLFDRLHGGRGTKDRIPFRWSARLSVARGVARALEYLHLNPISIVPHGNLKPSNILLDENEIVLVSDYGLSSIVANPIASQRLVAYKSPEFLMLKKVSQKSDIWSYGNLLLELLTGRISSQSTSNDEKGVDLCGWVHRAVREEWTAEIFDLEMMVHRSGCNGMLRLLQVAIRCCDKSPERRPEMSEVVREVESINVINVESESEEDLSLDQSLSLTEESISATPSVVIGDH